MALFFDADWFNAQMDERLLSREALAAASGMSPADLALVFKDQRELSAAEVAVFAEMLGATPAQIALHAGVSTPVPEDGGLEARLAELEARVARLEGLLTAPADWRPSPSRGEG